MVDHVEDQTHAIYKNNAWQLWLEDLRKLSYDADDLLDEITLELSRLKCEPQSKNQVRDMVLSSFKLTLPREIGKIQDKLEDIASEMERFFLMKCGHFTNKGTQLRTTCTTGRISTSLIDEINVIGRQKEKEETVEMLLPDDVRRTNISVIPILGMGGLGKTTLAQIVYNDEQVVKNFDLRMWVSVSAEIDMIRVTKSIIESATESRCKLSDLDPIQVQLQKLLRGTKFLLVLDDLWNENYGDWDVLRTPFRVGSSGSKILVTTRSVIVSSIVGTTPASTCQSCLMKTVGS